MNVYIDMGLHNKSLYDGCKVKEINGKLNLQERPQKAVKKIQKNAVKIIGPAKDMDYKLILTGRMTVWAYLAVYEAVGGYFKEVFYDNGKGESVKIK